MRPHRHPARRPSGFTLIELLTVIAIIGILAAIIIPVVGKVRNSARVSQSSSNLRQIGMAFQAYSADNRNLIPCAEQDAENISKLRWQGELNPYVAGRRISKDDGGDGAISPFFVCPYAVLARPQDIYDANGGVRVWRGGYGMNRRMRQSIPGVASPRTSALDSAVKRLSVTMFTTPSRTVTVGMSSFETWDPKADGTSNSIPNSGDPTRIDGRSALYLFLDGHVANLTPDVAAGLMRVPAP